MPELIVGPVFLGLLACGGISMAAIIVALTVQGKSHEQANELSRLRRRVIELERKLLAAIASDEPSEPAATQTHEPETQERVEPATELEAAKESADSAAAEPPPTVSATLRDEAPLAVLETCEPSPQHTTSLEEKLGMRVPIWIGGISLLLAGIFLVKLSAEHIVLTPRTRVMLGTAFGVILLIGAELMRRRSMRIAQALCGAGIADLFACLLAAANLYHFVSLPIAFALMAVLTFFAVVLSLRYGPFVALLGLIGGFATPAMISGGEPAAGPTLIYLLLLEIGLTAVTRRRQWMSLSLLTLIASLAWAMFYAIWSYESASRLWISGFVLGSVMVYIISAAGTYEDDNKPNISPLGIAFGAITSAALLIGLLIVRGEYSIIEYGMLMILGVGCMVLARLDERYIVVPWLTGAVSAIMLIVWTIHGRYHELELHLLKYAGLTLGFGAIYTLGGYVCLWRTARAQMWASLTTVAALAYLMCGYFGLANNAQASLPQWFAWWMAAGAGVVLFKLLVIPVWLKRAVLLDGESVLGTLALGGAAMWTLVVWWGIDPPWSATGWVAIAIAAALLIELQRIKLLQFALVWLTGLTITTLVYPGPFAQAIGDHVIFNILLAEYGLPALGFALIAWRLYRAGETKLAEAWQAISIITGWAMLTLLIRHGFHSNIRANTILLMEWGTYAFAWSAMGLVIVYANRALNQSMLKKVGRLLGVAGILIAILGPVLWANPLWRSTTVGSIPILNWLIYLYALPAGLGVMWAWLTRDEPSASKLCAIVSLILCFVFISLEVRQVFHGSTLKGGDISNAEMYAYSCVWILFGGLLLLLGILRQSMALRYASLVVMLVSVGKVFAYDMRHLEDLYRVVSFLGLGVSLLVLGYVYQRFVFRQPRQT